MLARTSFVPRTKSMRKRAEPCLKLSLPIARWQWITPYITSLYGSSLDAYNRACERNPVLVYHDDGILAAHARVLAARIPALKEAAVLK